MPRVLISYSHDAPSHSQKVLELADALRANGIDAIIDQYDPHPPQVWSMWMDQQIERADFVLMIFTERYYKRSRGEESPGIGHGVAWESVLIANELYESLHFNKKYIPVVFAGADKKWILPRMKGFTNYLLQEFTLENQNSFEMLYRHLTNQDATPAAPLGPLKKLGPAPRLHSVGIKSIPGNSSDREAASAQLERTSENTPIGISITELGAKRSKLQSDVERVAASISGACRNRIVEQLDWEPISECEVFCTKLIDECAVIDAIGALIEVRRDTSPADYDYISRTIDLLLPLNYAREKILRICELLQNGKVRFIEGEVGNKSVADVLMAGYDCAPIKLDAKSEKGVTAIDMDGPPPEAGMKPHQWNVLAFLIELVARYETVFHSSEPSNHNNTIDALAKTLESWIKGYAKMKKRTVYLMVNFPVDTLKREQALSTLTTISEIVPSLFFVEIVQRVDSTEQQIFQCLRLRLKDR